jgi:RNA polymerase sigma-70 factor (ECF subfamily)
VTVEPSIAGGSFERWSIEFRNRLRRMVEMRISPRLAGRIDPSDVVQETLVEAAQRFEDYCRKPTLSPYLWLRFLTLQRLNILYRRHVGTRKRSTSCESPLPNVEATSIALAEWFVDSGTSPSQAAVRREQRDILLQALTSMAPRDRELLTLRHFEQLSLEEAAQALGISLVAARRRYYRALERLQDLIAPLLETSPPH